MDDYSNGASFENRYASGEYKRRDTHPWNFFDSVDLLSLHRDPLTLNKLIKDSWETVFTISEVRAYVPTTLTRLTNVPIIISLKFNITDRREGF